MQQATILMTRPDSERLFETLRLPFSEQEIANVPPREPEVDQGELATKAVDAVTAVSTTLFSDKQLHEIAHRFDIVQPIRPIALSIAEQTYRMGTEIFEVIRHDFTIPQNVKHLIRIADRTAIYSHLEQLLDAIKTLSNSHEVAQYLQHDYVQSQGYRMMPAINVADRLLRNAHNEERQTQPIRLVKIGAVITLAAHSRSMPEHPYGS